jgi:hypothetical protein
MHHFFNKRPFWEGGDHLGAALFGYHPNERQRWPLSWRPESLALRHANDCPPFEPGGWLSAVIGGLLRFFLGRATHSLPLLTLLDMLLLIVSS